MTQITSFENPFGSIKSKNKAWMKNRRMPSYLHQELLTQDFQFT
jgi:hypothetical protein